MNPNKLLSEAIVTNHFEGVKALIKLGAKVTEYHMFLSRFNSADLEMYLFLYRHLENKKPFADILTNRG